MGNKTICGICGGKIGFLNRITNSGGLNDGNIICHQCFKKVSGSNDISGNLREHSLEEIKNLISTIPLIVEPIVEIKVSRIDKLSKLEKEYLHKHLGKDEIILNSFPCHGSSTDGILVMTEFKMVFISVGFFSLYGLNIYYYTQISSLKIGDNFFSFTDLFMGLGEGREKITIKKHSDFILCEGLLKEQIRIHKKYDKEGSPYMFQLYESGEIDKTKLLEGLLDK
jgi:hypothetical protein